MEQVPVRSCTRRGAAVDLVLDRARENRSQVVFTTARAVMPCGDYGLVVDGRLVAAVERKSLPDLVASVTGGKLRYALADLSALPRSAVVVEDRHPQIFHLDRVRPAVVADGLAELQVRWPNVPIVYAET